MASMSGVVLPNLDEHILHVDPITQFKEWYRVAADAQVPQHDAMTLATVSSIGQPSARMVLLKHVDERGFIFFTSYESPKGKDLASNPRCAVVFFWAELNRSVRIEGKIMKVSSEESDAYFATRPRDGQLSSLTSRQSTVVESREVLDRKFENLKGSYEGKKIPRPSYWGGYRIAPVRIEFWQARFARLNDRVEYVLQTDGSWLKRRLQP